MSRGAVPRRRARPRRAGPAADRRARPARHGADVAWVALAALVGVQAYALLHEVGHALAAWSVGLQLIGIESWSFGRPHVRLVGDLDGARGAWVAVAGALLPWLVAATALAVARPVRPAARWVAVAATIGLIGSLLPWAVIPSLGLRPPADDVTHFLQRSGAPAAVVAGGALLAIGALLALALRALGGPRRAAAALGSVVGVSRRPSAWVAVALSAAVVVAATVATGRIGTSDAVLPPPGFRLAADLRFPGGLIDEQLAGDSVSAAHRLEVWVEVRGARGPLRVDVVGPEGGRISVLALAAGSATERGSARTPPIALAAGSWSVQASAAPSEGRLVVGWRTAPLP